MSLHNFPDKINQPTSLEDNGSFGTLIFVHGAGVRTPALEVTLSLLRSQARSYSLPIDIIACNWGEIRGPALRLGGISVPGGLDLIASKLEDEQARWSLLLEDPLFELRFLNLNNHEFSPQANQRIEDMWYQLLTHAMEIEKNYATLSIQLTSAIETIKSEIKAEAIVLTGQNLPELAYMVTCAALALAQQQQPFAADDRDRIIRDLLTGSGWAVRGALPGPLGHFLSSIATPYVRRRRHDFLRVELNSTADILHYQVRGLEMRQHIRNCIEAANGPVLLVGHSLGGVACFETLLQWPELAPKVFISAGSQMAYFYEADALALLPSTTPLPEDFPRWINVYDSNDFLSFVCRPIFGDKVIDIEVSSRQPFPASHSSYWACGRFWEILSDESRR